MHEVTQSLKCDQAQIGVPNSKSIMKNLDGEMQKGDIELMNVIAISFRRHDHVTGSGIWYHTNSKFSFPIRS